MHHVHVGVCTDRENAIDEVLYSSWLFSTVSVQINPAPRDPRLPHIAGINVFFMDGAAARGFVRRLRLVWDDFGQGDRFQEGIQIQEVDRVTAGEITLLFSSVS